MKCLHRSLPSRRRPSRNLETVGFRTNSFRGLLSIHSRFGLQLRQVAISDPYTRDSGGFVASTTPPVATGWNDPCRTGLAPAKHQTPFQGVPKLSKSTPSLAGPTPARRASEGMTLISLHWPVGLVFTPARSSAAHSRIVYNCSHPVKRPCRIFSILPWPAFLTPAFYVRAGVKGRGGLGSS